MKKPLFIMLFLSIFFPFIKTTSFETYNQPTAFIFAVMVILSCKSLTFPKSNLYKIFIFTPLLIFPIHFLLMDWNIGLYEIRSLYTYIAIPVISLAFMASLNQQLSLVKKILEGSILIWALVGLFQLFIDRNFLTWMTPALTSSEALLESGRGVISLAPEPTHYAFHALLLGVLAFFLGLKSRYIFLAFSQAAFLAFSTGGIFVILVSLAISTLRSPSGKALYPLALFMFFGFCVTFFASNWLAESRIGGLFLNVLADPTLLFADYSVNVRILGSMLSFEQMLLSLLAPHGVGNSAWRDFSAAVLQANPYLLGLSSSGPPSGIGVLLFESGYLILPFICSLLTLCFSRKSFYPLFFSILALMISAMQYNLGSPDLIAAFTALYWAKARSERRRDLIFEEKLLKDNYYRNKLSLGSYR